MNVKCEREAVTQILGRSVAVPLLGPRAVAPPEQRETSSVEKRILKRTSSTGSIGTLSSCRSRPHTGGTNIKNQSARRRLQNKSEQSQQHVRLGGKTTTDESSTVSQRSSISTQGKKALSTEEILMLCHESEPSKVFEVDLHGKGLTFSPQLGKFHKLKILDLSSNCIRRIAGLDSNVDLRELKLYDNQITAIEGLDLIKELCCLQLQHNKITTIGRGLNSLKKLQSLRLDNNQIAHLEIPELLSCSAMTSLDLSHNKLQSLAPLSYLPNLEELFAAGNIIQNTGDLTKCKKLQEIDLARNLISQLSGLANLPNLQILDISHNHIQSLRSVGKLRSMEQLNINGNKVDELSSFASLFPSLQILYACDNMISKWDEIGSLSGCVNLVELDVTGNPFIMEDGEMPDYHHTVPEALHNLEVIDGVIVRKLEDKQDTTAVIRPMTASSIISIRQIDSQLKANTEQQGSLFKDFTERIDALWSLVKTLPSESPRPSYGPSAITKCSIRSRLAQARSFAAINIDTDKGEENL